MTVTDRKRRLDAAKSINDIEPGDMVRRYGHRGVGLVESEPEHGFVWVAWKDGRRDYLPLAGLRIVKPGGSEFDRRRP